MDNARRFVDSMELDEAMQWSTSNVGSPRVSVLEAALDTQA
jgi:hypothetical protein